MISARIKILYNLGKLFNFAEEQEIELIAFTFYRSPDQQIQEFIKGKSKIKSNGPHQRWTAIDLAIVENGKALFDASEQTIAKYRVLGDFWKSLGSDCIWGGDFKFAADVYHFEVMTTIKKEHNYV